MEFIYGHVVHVLSVPSRENEGRNIVAIKKCNWQKRQTLSSFVTFIFSICCFCNSIWGFYVAEWCRRGADDKTPLQHWVGKGRKSYFSLSRKIKASKVESNLDEDRQTKKIFQSVAFIWEERKEEEKEEELIMKTTEIPSAGREV